jgi:protein-arginine kinase activator protein McsA
MNQDQYEAAAELREKIVEIEKELEKQRRAKRAGPSPREEVTDATVAALRLRSELQKAIEEENYEQAAALRKQLADIEVRIALSCLQKWGVYNSEFSSALN